MDKKCQLIELYSFLGNKWTMLLFHNLNEEIISFSELNRKTDRLISSRLLSDRLKEFEKFGLIEKKESGYRISNVGIKLKNILHQIKEFAIDNSFDIPKYCKNGRCYCDIALGKNKKEKI